MMTKPYPFQREDIDRIDSDFHGRCLIANEMGTGKSLEALLWAVEHPTERPAIVVCPASLKWNWEREAAHHCGIRVNVLEGTKPDLFRCKFTKHNFIIVNYDILKYWLKFLKGLKPKLVVFDECHMIGNRTSQRTKACKELAEGVPQVLALSGTPLTNRPAELFPTLNILRPELFPAWWPYAHEFCSPRRTPWGWDFKGATHLPKLRRLLLDEVMIRRRKEDVLKDLPAKQRTVIPIELPKMSDYHHAEKDFLGWIAKQDPLELFTARNSEALVKLGHLKRLAGRLKLPAVMDWVDSYLEESNGKLVIFAVHRAIIGELHDRYGRGSVVVDGSVVGRKRQRAVDQFQNHKTTRLFIGNVRAAGVGLTLTAADVMCFAELDWVPGIHTQAEDRIHRIGQKKTAFCYWLVAHGTIEEKLAGILTTKQQTLNQILDGKGKGDQLNIAEELTRQLSEGR